jgi:imidazole glycerol-phosphate synthase subunit HisH
VTIAVIDYGMGNLRSVSKALEHVAAARRCGHRRSGRGCRCRARGLSRAGRDARLHARTRCARPASGGSAGGEDKPFLGICIGLQMLFEHSEEGDVPGLGFSPACSAFSRCEKMVDAKGERLKVPHMGWNEVWQSRTPCGRGSPTVHASISCTATASSGRSGAASPAPPITASPLPVRWRGIISSRSSSS